MSLESVFANPQPLVGVVHKVSGEEHNERMMMEGDAGVESDSADSEDTIPLDPIEIEQRLAGDFREENYDISKTADFKQVTVESHEIPDTYEEQETSYEEHTSLAPLEQQSAPVAPEDLEDGELEDGELDDDEGVAPAVIPPPLHKERKHSHGDKDAENAEVSDSGEKGSKKSHKRKKKEKRKKRHREDKEKDKSKKKRSKYVDHDRNEETEYSGIPPWQTLPGPYDSPVASPEKEDGTQKRRGKNRHQPDRSPPGPYDSPYESPPGPYDSPSDEEDDDFGSPGKQKKTSMLDMLGDGYLDPTVALNEKEEIFGRRMRKKQKRDRQQNRRQNQEGRGRGRGKQGMQENQRPRYQCKFYMEGKCLKGDNCTYSHDFEVLPRKEVCKYYVTSVCHKGDDCIFMHSDYPCKWYHTGATCFKGEDCKFSHEEMDEETREAFFRNLNEENNQENEHGSPRKKQALLGSPPHMNDGNSHLKKIPSLFDIKVFPPSQGVRPTQPQGPPPPIGPPGPPGPPGPLGPPVPPGPHMAGPPLGQSPPTRGMRPHFYDMNNSGHPNGPMGIPNSQPGLLGPPPMMRPPMMPPRGMPPGPPGPHGSMGQGLPLHHPPGQAPPHVSGPHSFYNDFYQNQQQPSTEDTIQSPEPEHSVPPSMLKELQNQQQMALAQQMQHEEQQPEPPKQVQQPESDVTGENTDDRSENEEPAIEVPTHLAPKQRELFMRIQHKQKQRERDEDDKSQDQQTGVTEVENWNYSSDEEDEGKSEAPRSAPVSTPVPTNNLVNIINSLNTQPTTMAIVPKPSFDITTMLNAIRNQTTTDNVSDGGSSPNKSSPPVSADPRSKPVVRADPRTANNSKPSVAVSKPAVDPVKPTVFVPPPPVDMPAPPVIDSYGTEDTFPYKVHIILIERKRVLPNIDWYAPQYKNDPRVKKLESEGKLPPRQLLSEPKTPSIDPRIQKSLSLPGHPSDPRARTSDPRVQKSDSLPSPNRPTDPRSAKINPDPRSAARDPRSVKPDPRSVKPDPRSVDPRSQSQQPNQDPRSQKPDPRTQAQKVDPRLISQNPDPRTMQHPHTMMQNQQYGGDPRGGPQNGGPYPPGPPPPHMLQFPPPLPMHPRGMPPHMMNMPPPHILRGMRGPPPPLPPQLNQPPPNMPPALTQPPPPEPPTRADPRLARQLSSSGAGGRSPSDISSSTGPSQSLAHRNDPRFKKKPKPNEQSITGDKQQPLINPVQSLPGGNLSPVRDPRHHNRHNQRRDNLEYSSPLGGSSGNDGAQSDSYNSYNRPTQHNNPSVWRTKNNETKGAGSPKSSSPGASDNQFSGMYSESSFLPEQMQLPPPPEDDRSIKDMFKTIDPTASPFC